MLNQFNKSDTAPYSDCGRNSGTCLPKWANSLPEKMQTCGTRQRRRMRKVTVAHPKASTCDKEYKIKQSSTGERRVELETKQYNEDFLSQTETYSAEFSYLFYTVFIRCLRLRAHSSRRLSIPEYKLVLLTRV